VISIPDEFGCVVM